MTKDLTDFIKKVLRECGRPLSPEEVRKQLEENSVTSVPEYIDERSHPTAAIQAELDGLASVPDTRVKKLVIPGASPKYQWIDESLPPNNSLASRFS
jgi:hypothetical protein